MPTKWLALGHLCITQVLYYAEKSSCSSSNPQEAVPCLTGEDVGIEVPLGSSPSMWDMDSWYLLPQFTPGNHWCYCWVGCFPNWHQATRCTYIHMNTHALYFTVHLTQSTRYTLSRFQWYIVKTEMKSISHTHTCHFLFWNHKVVNWSFILYVCAHAWYVGVFVCAFACVCMCTHGKLCTLTDLRAVDM